jgi:hypothetical protein
MAMYGNRGLFFSSPIYKPVAAPLAKKKDHVLTSSSLLSRPLTRLVKAFQAAEQKGALEPGQPDQKGQNGTAGSSTNESELNFLQLLLLGAKVSLCVDMRSYFAYDTLGFVQLDEQEQFDDIIMKKRFTIRVEIVSAQLRSWMNLEPGEPCYHDVTISSSYEPNTLHKTYIITQVIVTDIELADRAIQQANAELYEERERIHALLQRQYELIEILRSETSTKNDDLFTEKINFLRGTIAKESKSRRETTQAEAEEIRLDKVLGRGNVSVFISDDICSRHTLTSLFSSPQFGTVYLGEWRGATVAVKRMVLPAAMTNSERAHKMAVMEIGISSSMSHPHLVQTYTYSIRPIQEERLVSVFNPVFNFKIYSDPPWSPCRPQVMTQRL